jgi:hypothetical protein
MSLVIDGTGAAGLEMAQEGEMVGAPQAPGKTLVGPAKVTGEAWHERF